MKVLKRGGAIFSALIMIGAVFSGCTDNNGSSTNSQSPTSQTQSNASASGNETKDTLVIGTMAATMGVPVQYAYEKGYFDEENIDVTLELFSTGVPINEAMAAKEIDVGVSGLASIFSLANDVGTWVGESNSGSSGLFIYVRADSEVAKVSGAFAPNPEILGNAETVKGLRVLGNLGTSKQYHVIAYADAMGLSGDDVSMINMDEGPAYTAFLAGEGDALSASMPLCWTFEDDPAYVRVSEFDALTGYGVGDGVLVRNDVLESKRDVIVRFLRALWKASNELQSDPVMRAEFSYKFFTENGKEYKDGAIEREIEIRNYWVEDYIGSDNYIFGEGMYSMVDYYIADGKIEESSRSNILKNMDSSLLAEALGIDIKQVQ